MLYGLTHSLEDTKNAKLPKECNYYIFGEETRMFKNGDMHLLYTAAESGNGRGKGSRVVVVMGAKGRCNVSLAPPLLSSSPCPNNSKTLFCREIQIRNI